MVRGYSGPHEERFCRHPKGTPGPGGRPALTARCSAPVTKTPARHCKERVRRAVLPPDHILKTSTKNDALLSPTKQKASYITTSFSATSPCAAPRKSKAPPQFLPHHDAVSLTLVQADGAS